MTEILVTGASGLVGSRFIEVYKDKYSFITPSRPGFDLTKPETISRYTTRNLDAIIHLAAFTDVTAAETQRDNKAGPCWKTNVEGTKSLVDLIDPKTKFIYVSTDMVFSGSSGPYVEKSNPEKDSNKVTWYGYSKGQAEKLVPENGSVLRIIYPVRAEFNLKQDYLRKPLRLYDEGKLYPLFSDQQISISFIDEVASVLEKIIDQKINGVFHASSNDTTNPYELITYLITKSGRKLEGVKQSSIDSLGNSVRYPKFGGLKVEETEKKLGMKFSSWKDIVDKLIEQGISTS